MKNHLLLLLLLFFISVSSHAQAGHQDFFVIQGKIENAPSDTITGYITTYIGNSTRIKIPLHKDGSFQQKIAIEGNQNFSLLINSNPITLYVNPDDTVKIRYNNNDIEHTITLRGNNEMRTNELNFNYQFGKRFFLKMVELQKKLYMERKQPDSLKVSWVNEEYNEELSFLMSDTALSGQNLEIFANEIYYNNFSILQRIFIRQPSDMLKYDLVVNAGSHIPKMAPFDQFITFVESPLKRYQKLSDFVFINCPSYRSAMYGYIRSFNNGRYPPKPFLDHIQYYPSKGNDKTDKEWPDLFLWEPYYCAMAEIPYIPMRDWFITNMLIDNFTAQDFNTTEQILFEYLPKCRNEEYKDSLLAIYNRSKQYKPGMSAPNFTLKDENGKSISLSDFKGKAIVLDFWGVHFGPCIADMESNIPTLHEKYKNKEVIFINICVEDTRENWIAAIKKYNLKGINLFAKGWSENPVCQLYNVNGIPHYIIIDKNGDFAAYNTSPYVLLQKDNILDKVLSKE